MEVLETLAVALGFATLAGLNLYLVVLITGTAINLGWVDVASKYPELMVLGEPAVIAVAGIFFCLEFFSDKIPWVDSLWDTVHTLIRPVGGGLLAMHTLGPVEPGFEVIIAMLAGGTTLVAHSFKAGSRLAINASPEPFTNIAASVTEDVAVLGGLALMAANPLLAGVVFLLFISMCLYLAPKLFRRIKSFVWLLWHKVTSPVRRGDSEELLYAGLTSDEDLALSKVLDAEAPEVEWSIGVLVGNCKKFRSFTPITFGKLVSDASDESVLHFIGRRMWRDYHATVSLEGLQVTQEPRFFSEDVVVYDRKGSRKLTFRLPSGQRAVANRVAEEILKTRKALVSDVSKLGDEPAITRQEIPAESTNS